MNHSEGCEPNRNRPTEGGASALRPRIEEPRNLGARPHVAEDPVEGRKAGLVQAVRVAREGIRHQDDLVLELRGITG